MPARPGVEPYTLDVTRRTDPYPYYALLRSEDPVHYSPVEDIWVLTRFDDCLAAFSDWQGWSSQRRGNLLNDLPQRVGRTPRPPHPPPPPPAPPPGDSALPPPTRARRGPGLPGASAQ